MKTKKSVDSDRIQEKYITNLQVGGGFKDSCLGTFIYPLKVGENKRFPILKQKQTLPRHGVPSLGFFC